MFCLAPLALLLTASPGPFPTLAQAAHALARGEDEEAAFRRLRGAGKPGLWALHEAARQARDRERGRLFEAIGRFGTPEGEWALAVELRGNSDLEGRAGAIRGLARLGPSRACAPLLRAAGEPEERLRAELVEALVNLKGCGEERQRALLKSSKERERALGLQYLLRAGDPEKLNVAIGPALADDSTLVRRQGVELARRVRDASWTYALSELARGADVELATAAVEVMEELGGYGATSELVQVAADPASGEEAWRLAASKLRARGPEGFRALVGAVARARDDRRPALLGLVVEAISEAELEQAVELLDEPTPGRAAVGRDLLERAGDKAREVARRRKARALPELEAAITAFLEGRPGTVRGLRFQSDP